LIPGSELVGELFDLALPRRRSVSYVPVEQHHRWAVADALESDP